MMLYFDTDVLIHFIVNQENKKHEKAIKLVSRSISDNTFFISFVSLQETAFVLSKLGFEHDFISQNVKTFSHFAKAGVTVEIFHRACVLAESLGFKNINDCLHIAIAEEFCDELVTYNKKDFQKASELTPIKISIL